MDTLTSTKALNQIEGLSISIKNPAITNYLATYALLSLESRVTIVFRRLNAYEKLWG